MVHAEKLRHDEALTEIQNARQKGKNFHKYEGGKGLVTFVDLEDWNRNLKDDDGSDGLEWRSLRTSLPSAEDEDSFEDYFAYSYD